MRTPKIVLTLILLSIALPAVSGVIHDAAQEGDLDAVRALLSNDPSLMGDRDPAGNTPLHIAAIYGQEEIAEYLISNGAEIDAGDNENTTPLDVAAKYGRMAVVELLASHGADVNHKDFNNMSSILWASSNGNVDIIRFLISKGADLATGDNAGMTCLHFAAYEGHKELAEFLLVKGLNVNAKKTNGSTPLHGAALDGNMEMIKLLLAHGAKLDSKNEAGYTPFLTAVVGCQKQAAEYLASKGADMQAKLVTSEGETALMQAIGNCRDGDMASWLIENGADVNEVGGSGLTPLSLSALIGSTEMVQLLLENGAKVEGQKHGIPTPLYLAAREGEAAVVELLILNGANVNVKDDHGMTPLMFAVMNRHDDVARLLIENGARVDLKDKDCGRTALHLAAIRGNIATVEILVGNGARLDDTDRNGRTALNLAAKYGHTKVAELLVANGAVASDKIEDNFGISPQLSAKLASGEAILWHLGNCGYAVKTKNHFLVFDYWNRGATLDNPCLANGAIDPIELADQNVMVFVTHDHADHFDTTIYGWVDKVKNITYVYGFDPGLLYQYHQSVYPGPEYHYIGPRDTLIVDGTEILTIRANDAGVGFLVKVDGLILYHAGDHAGWLEGEKGGYTSEIDYLSDHVRNVDIAFLNVTGCHAHGEKPLWEGTCYTIDKLQPRVVIPTHAYDREYLYRDYAAKIQKAWNGVTVFCPDNRGDRFVYSR